VTNDMSMVFIHEATVHFLGQVNCES
jgi:hypothetical protein